MTSPKELRAAPERYLERYTASIKFLKNVESPSSLLDEKFVETNFISDGASLTTSAMSNIDIGFDLKINGLTYRKIYINEVGFAVLQDSSGFALTDVMTSASVLAIRSSFINNRNHILICPWFSFVYVPTKTIHELADNTFYNTLITTDKQIDDIVTAKDTKNWPYDAIDRGARYANYYDATNGNAFVIRWTSYNGAGSATVPITFFKWKFELALFENGKIEFRYWPKNYYEKGPTATYTNSSVAGLFWSGPNFGSDKFRDFAPLVNYQKNIRKINEMGGSSYDATYSQSSKPYANQIDNNYWPGPAIISFTPPVNSGKFLPRKQSKAIGSSRELIRQPGLFDDRKSIIFGTGNSEVVHMPSTLSSRLIGDSSPSVDVGTRSLLFTSGSIQLTGSQNKDAIDGLLNSLELESATSQRVNFSFNETNKNYLETSSNSEFYATGSALVPFGEGFSEPLKSKKQIKISLPVEKTTLMPPISSSIYYYDVVQKRWTYAVPVDWEKIPVGFDGPTGGPANSYVRNGGFADRGEDFQVYYNLAGAPPSNPLYARIAETSHGFDAVGRKVVVGATQPGQAYSITGKQAGVRSDLAVGMIVNKSSGINENTFDSAVEKKYSRSLTDYSQFFPSSSQQVKIDVDYPFVIEKVVVDIPFHMSGGWFNDMTTCNKAYLTSSGAGLDSLNGFTSGVVDFGGPGITFSMFSPKKALGSSYMDLIASGTITHNFDNTSSITLYKESIMKNHMLRPIGFKSFSNPTAVVDGVWNGTDYEYTGKIHLELVPSIAGGLSFARNDTVSGTVGSDTLARSKAISLLTSNEVPPTGDDAYTSQTNYMQRVYLQQISPLSRGQTGVEFNGLSVLGRNIAGFNLENTVKNPLYTTVSASLPGDIKSTIDSSTFSLDALMCYSTVDSAQSPYLIMPGESLTFSISKTRPVVHKANYLGTTFTSDYLIYGDYTLTGSHDIVQLNTGSIDITLYGSYVREGVGYNP